MPAGACSVEPRLSLEKGVVCCIIISLYVDMFDLSRHDKLSLSRLISHVCFYPNFGSPLRAFLIPQPPAENRPVGLPGGWGSNSAGRRLATITLQGLSQGLWLNGVDISE